MASFLKERIKRPLAGFKTYSAFKMIIRIPMIQYVVFAPLLLFLYEAGLKSNPHPERPDRLRAISASLSAAGASS
ncbi:hypothetical protein OROGR_031105 [Orobanche gracilis]